MPDYLLVGDQFNAEFIVQNKSNESTEVDLQWDFPACFYIAQKPENKITVNAGEIKKISVSIAVKMPEKLGSFPLNVKMTSSQCKDELQHNIKILPGGIEKAWTSQQTSTHWQAVFNLPEKMIEGTLRGEFVYYVGQIGQMMDALQSIIREPSGCFEQVSSSNYPNVLALQLLRKTGKNDKALEDKCLAFLKNGYTKIANYETKQGGFEWYGGTPPHAGLTAYGLMQLNDMQKVYTGVETALIERTKTFLLNLKNGKGNFNMPSEGKYGAFYHTPQNVNDAYICYALANCNEKNIALELNQVVKNALQNKDDYQMALAANACFSLGKQMEYEHLVEKLLQSQLKDGSWQQSETSITNSKNINLTLETTALAVEALMHAETKYVNEVNRGVAFILSQRSPYGGFGSTQATILCLRTIGTFLSSKIDDAPAKNVVVKLNDQPAFQKDIANHSDKIICNDLANYVQSKATTIDVTMNECKSNFAQSGVTMRWYEEVGVQSEKCPVQLSQNFAATTCKVGEPLRLDVQLTNQTKAGVASTVAVINIPAGFSFQAWQLKEMQEKGIFDYYELTNVSLAVYYRGMDAKEVKTLHFDLKAELAGTYRSEPSKVFEYYNNQFVWYSNGTKINILP